MAHSTDASRKRPADRPKARGSYKKSETSRKQVLDSAVRALAKNGFAKTSVNDIAVAAGMSKGAVHYHFESKDDLIAQVLEQCAEVLTDRARAAWEGPGDPRDKVRAAVREMWAMRRDSKPELRVLADLMAQALHDTKLRKPIASMFRSMTSEVVDHLTAILDEAGLKPKVPPHLIPRLLLGALDGLVVHDFFDPPSGQDEEQIIEALELFALSMVDLA